MRIATWNVERLRHRRDIDTMLLEIDKADADILVLTETDARLRPGFPHCCHTQKLHDLRPGYYSDTENRVSVYSRYRCLKQHETFDTYTAICVELETSRGNLLVYGTIMGVFGNREASFRTDLMAQMADIRRLSAQGNRLCVVGDYNLSFCDSYYYTREGRALVENTLRDCGIDILTRDRRECVDHIALTAGFASAFAHVEEWNTDKRLSDHKGIVVEIA